MDVLWARQRRVVAYECKGYRSSVKLAEVEKWLTHKVPTIYAALKGQGRYSGFELALSFGLHPPSILMWKPVCRRRRKPPSAIGSAERTESISANMRRVLSHLDCVRLSTIIISRMFWSIPSRKKPFLCQKPLRVCSLRQALNQGCSKGD